MTVVLLGMESEKTGFARYTYDAPLVTGIRLANAGSTGKGVITVVGGNFGSSDYTPRSRMGGTACIYTSWISDSSLQCSVPSGENEESTDMAILVTVANQIMKPGATFTRGFTYDQPAMSSVAPGNAKTLGATDITVIGYALAPAYDATAEARVGGTSSENTVWISGSSIRSRVSSGVSKNKRVVVSIENHQDTISNIFSFNHPSVKLSLSYSLSYNQPPSANQNIITVSGTNFAFQDQTTRIRVAQSDTEDYQTDQHRLNQGTGAVLTTWISNTALRCSAAVGLQASQKLTVTTGMLDSQLGLGQMSDVFSYDIGFVSGITPTGVKAAGSASYEDILGSCELGTAGGYYSSKFVAEIVCSQAKNLGLCPGSIVCPCLGFYQDFSGYWRLCYRLNWNGTMALPLSMCDSVGKDEIAPLSNGLRCNLLNVNVGNVENYCVGCSFCVRITNAMVLGGRNFGLQDSTLGSRLQGTSNLATLWFSDSGLQLKAPAGIERSHSLMVTVARKVGTETEILSYFSATLAVTTFSNAPPRSMNLFAIKVVGSGWDKNGCSVRMCMGSSASATTLWISETSINARPISGVSGSFKVMLTVGVQYSSVSRPFSYNIPSATFALMKNQPVTGSTILTLHGVGMSIASAASSILRGGHTPCEATRWCSDSSVTSLVASGVSGSNQMRITAGQFASSFSEALSYGANVIGLYSITQRNVAGLTTQAIDLILGSGLGHHDFTTAVRFGGGGGAGIGGSDSGDSPWCSTTSISSRFARGRGFSERVIITAGSVDVVSSRSSGLSYDALTVYHVRALGSSSPNSFGINTPTTGLISVTILGTNYAVHNPSLQARVGFSGSPTTVWASDTQLSTTPSSSGNSESRTLAVSSSVLVNSGTSVLSYNLPTSSSTKADNVPKAATPLQIFSGQGYGVAESPTLRLGTTAAENTIWNSQTSALCRSASSFSASHHVAISAGWQIGSRTEAITFDAAALWYFPSLSIPKPISQNVNLIESKNATTSIFSGGNYGKYQMSSGLRAGGSASESSIWTSDSCVSGKFAVTGNLNSRVLLITSSDAFCGACGSKTFAISYDAPRIMSSSPPNRLIASSQSLTILGSGFLPCEYSQSVRIGGSTNEATAWTSDSMLFLKPSTVVIANTQVVATAGMMASSLTEAFFYDPKVVSGLGKGNAASTGSTSVVILGGSFALSASSPASSIGHSSCDSSMWMSDSSLLTKQVSGLGFTLSAVITIGRLKATMSEVLSFQLPSISAQGYNTRASMFTDVFTLIGSGFSHSVAERVHSTHCEQTTWHSQSAISGMTAQGTGRSEKLSVTAGTLVGTQTESVSYLDAFVSNAKSANAATRGENIITVWGRGLGDTSYTMAVTSGFSSAEIASWLSNTAMCCRFQVPGGVVATMIMRITSGQSCAGSTSEIFSFDKSQLSRTQSMNTRTAGTMTTTIFGSRFSLFSATGIICSRTAAEASEWVADSQIKCKSVSGVARSILLALTAGGQTASLAGSISYDNTCLTDFQPQNSPTKSSVSISISMTGGMFSVFQPTLIARVADTKAEASNWLSDSTVACGLSNGLAGSGTAKLTIGAQVGSLTDIFSYNTISISGQLSGNQASLDALSTMTIIGGASFGNSQQSIKANVGLTACSVSSWAQDYTSVFCKVARGCMASQWVSLTAGTQVASRTESLSFEVPVVSLLRQQNHVNDKSTSVTLMGWDFRGNTRLYSMQTRLSQTASAQSLWIGTSNILCKVWPGAASTNRAQVTAGFRIGSISRGMSFEASSVLSAILVNLPALDAVMVTLIGNGLGTTYVTGSVRAGYTSCQSTEWGGSYTRVTCKVASIGLGASMKLAITAGGLAATLTNALSIDTPATSSVMPTNGPMIMISAVSISVTGGMFSVFQPTLIARVADTKAEASNWLSDSTVACGLSNGLAGSGTAKLTIGAQVGSLTDIFSYNTISISGQLSGNQASLDALSTMTIIGGASFGNSQQSIKANVGLTACSVSSWAQDYTSVFCKVARGCMASQWVSLTAGTQVASRTESLSFEVPVVSLLRQQNHVNDKSTSVTLMGWDFRGNTRLYSMQTRLSQTASAQSLWIGTSNILCKVWPGAASTNRAQVTAGFRIGSISRGMSFEASSVLSAILVNLPALDAVMVTLIGNGLGTTYVTGSVRAGYTSCQSTEWGGSYTRVTCKVASIGLGASMKLAITAGGLAATLTNALSIDTPATSSVMPTNGPMMMSTPIFLTGSGFEPIKTSINAKTSYTSCESSLWVSTSALKCHSAYGSHYSIKVHVTVGTRVGTTTGTFTYDGGTISMLHISSNVPASILLSMQVTLLGTSLGSKHTTIKARTGGSACESTTWGDDYVSVVCNVARAGHRETMMIAITVHSGVHHSGTVTESISYDAPNLSLVTISNIPARNAYSTLAIFGLGFESGASHTFSAQSGASKCEWSIWQSSSSIRCRVAYASSHGSKAILVTSGAGVGSRSEVMSFQPGSVSSTKASNAPVLRNVSMTVSGRGLLDTDAQFTERARLGQSACESTYWAGDSRVLCKIANSGPDGSSRISITAGNRLLETQSRGFSFDLQGLNKISDSNRPSGTYFNQARVAAEFLTMNSSMSATSFSHLMRIGSTILENSLWFSDSSLFCKLATGHRGSLKFILTLGQRPESISVLMSYDEPVVGFFVPTNTGIPITVAYVFGVLAPILSSHSIRISTTTGEASSWIAVTSVTCKVGKGVGSSKGLVVTSGLQSGSLSSIFSYSGASFSGMSMNVPCTGSISISVTGSAFSNWLVSPKLRTGNTDAERSKWTSESQLYCRVGAGVQTQLRTAVSVYVSVGTVSKTVTYDRPILTSVNPLNGPILGRHQITLSGRGFGTADYSPKSKH
jgi:hypothetical protein